MVTFYLRLFQWHVPSKLWVPRKVATVKGKLCQKPELWRKPEVGSCWKGLSMVYWSARAAVTLPHPQGGFHNRSWFSQDSGGWKFKIRALVGLFSSEASLLGV